MNPRLCLACAATLVALPAAASAAIVQPPITTVAPGTLTVCTFGGFPPTSYAAAGGTWAGLDATFVGRFARSVGLSVTPRISTSFAGIWQRPGTGECDMAAAGITVTNERRQQAAASTFSAPYHATLRAYVVRRGSVLTGPRGLAGKTVLVVKGSIAQEDVQRRVRRAGVAGVRIRFVAETAPLQQAVRA
ncbi:MAG: substrate-binding periplasmic protein, partial [Miltoncostaeaceae bacterium]